MSWKSLAAPLLVLCVGLVLIGAMLSAPLHNGTGKQPHSPSRQDDNLCDKYPAPNPNRPAGCDLVRTPTSYPEPLDTSETPAASATTTATLTATAITTQSPLGTPTSAASTPGATRATPTESSAVATEETVPADEPTVEETPTPSDELVCLPGVPLTISGSGPPRAPILLYFDQRVVGGGSISPAGEFALPLLVGRERPGEYMVVVRIRGTTDLLYEQVCVVPGAEPIAPTAEPF